MERYLAHISEDKVREQSAAEHAKEHGMDRVIYVIPYMSIIEQNAAVFREILGQAGC